VGLIAASYAKTLPVCLGEGKQQRPVAATTVVASERESEEICLSNALSSLLLQSLHPDLYFLTGKGQV